MERLRNKGEESDGHHNPTTKTITINISVYSLWIFSCDFLKK